MAAGKGTRMGEIGKLLPKPLWPVFESTLLGLQIKHVQAMGVKRIVLNSHHNHEEIKKYVEGNFPGVLISHEEELLGSGGGIHKVINEKMVDCSKPLMILNSDSFLLMDASGWEELLMMMKDMSAGVGLFLVEINKNDAYNRVDSKCGVMTGIDINGEGDPPYRTYSGFGLVLPEYIKKNEGVSGFFKSVADYENEKVICHHQNALKLYDFGTIDKYKEAITQILRKQQNSPMFQLLENSNSILLEEINIEEESYRSKVAGQVNFSMSESPDCDEKFVIGGTEGPGTVDSGVRFLN